MTRKRGHMALWLRLICVLSLLMVGFGHRPFPTVSDTLSSGAGGALSAYALPDGSLPFICTVPSTGSEDGATLTYQGCDACRIVASFCLATPVVLPVPLGIQETVERPIPGSITAFTAPLPHDAPPRAPPGVMTV
ncbi:MAG: hypothetical protein K9H25_21720 [Rhodospirillum sp.]|nr:hypothetical protein [Rhodospirillum sp.]MCF8491171.1 hypothetical protein [Rhodospirillum sp.]MCF8502497.1 hypothetical protein [Rhodospirillum sp.]